VHLQGRCPPAVRSAPDNRRPRRIKINLKKKKKKKKNQKKKNCAPRKKEAATIFRGEKELHPACANRPARGRASFFRPGRNFRDCRCIQQPEGPRRRTGGFSSIGKSGGPAGFGGSGELKSPSDRPAKNPAVADVGPWSTARTDIGPRLPYSRSVNVHLVADDLFHARSRGVKAQIGGGGEFFDADDADKSRERGLGGGEAVHQTLRNGSGGQPGPGKAVPRKKVAAVRRSGNEAGSRARSSRSEFRFRCGGLQFFAKRGRKHWGTGQKRCGRAARAARKAPKRPFDNHTPGDQLLKKAK